MAVIGPTIETVLLNQVAGLAFERSMPAWSAASWSTTDGWSPPRRGLREGNQPLSPQLMSVTLCPCTRKALERVPEWRDPVRLAHHAERSGASLGHVSGSPPRAAAQRDSARIVKQRSSMSGHFLSPIRRA